MNHRSRHGKADGVTVATIALAAALALLVAVICAVVMIYLGARGIVVDKLPPERSTRTASTAPKDAEGLTEAEMAEMSRKLRAVIARTETTPAVTQPTTAADDPSIDQLEAQIKMHLRKVAELQEKLDRTIDRANRLTTTSATSTATVPARRPTTQP